MMKLISGVLRALPHRPLAPHTLFQRCIAAQQFPRYKHAVAVITPEDTQNLSQSRRLQGLSGAVLRRVAVFVAFAFCASSPSWAKIEIQGTAEEKAEIQKAIDDMKGLSPTAKKLYEQLEAESTTVTIKFGNVPDIGGASTDNKSVVLSKAAIATIKQIDKPGGGGQAGEEATLKFILAHEALGHILQGLRKNPSGNGEDVAVAFENILHAEAKSTKRTKYYEKVDKKDTIPYADGSRVDITDALKASPTSTGKQPFARIDQTGSLSLSGSRNADGSIGIGLNPGAGVQHLTLDTSEFGGGIDTVPILGFLATLRNSLLDPLSNDFPLVVTDFTLMFDSFPLGSAGQTGLNLLQMISASRTPIGDWDFTSDGSFTFEFAGDFLWDNALFDLSNNVGYALESFTGAFNASGPNSLLGIALVEGGKYGPSSVPEPPSLLLVLCGMAVVLLFLYRPRFAYLTEATRQG